MLFVFSACGSGIIAVDNEAAGSQQAAEENLIVVPDSNGQFMANTVVQCGGPPSFLAGSLENPVLLADSTVADGALQVFENFAIEGEGAWWPQDGYWVLTNNETELLMAHIGHEGEVTLIGSELVNVSWQPTAIRGGGPCPIQVPLPEGLHEVDWRLDPSQPLDKTSSTLLLLATGRACSSGQPMGERLRQPQILLTQQSVYLLLVADRPAGAQECPGNPEEPVTIDLGEPIGDRPLVNARIVTGTLADYVPVSPCGQLEPLLPQDLNEAVGLDGPPERTQC